MSYTKHNFATGDVILAAPFNAMEDQIAANEQAIAGKAAASALTSLAGRVTANETAIAGKQAALTFDDTPTQNSNNPVKSGGVYTALAGKAAAADLTSLAGRVTTNETAIAGKYTKPSGGIPSTDLASAVQTSLGKADTALQSVPNTYRTASDQDTIDGGKASASDLTALAGRVTALEGSVGLSAELKAALLQIASKAAYIDGGGQTYYQALYNALYASRTLTAISAVLNLNGATIYENSGLDSLKQYLTVTASYDDSSTATVAAANYTLSGALAAGTSTITVSYSGKTTTFTVSVASSLPSGYTRLQYVAADGQQYIDTGLAAEQPERAEYEIMYTSMPNTKGGHILSSGSTYFPFFKGSGSSKTLMGLYWQNEADSTASLFAWELNVRYKLEGYPDAKVDNVTVYTLSKGQTHGTPNFYLFTFGGGITNTNYRFNGRLYSMKVYGANNALLRDFIPCKNGSNVAGLYDTVTSAFYSSGSGAELIAGEVA